MAFRIMAINFKCFYVSIESAEIHNCRDENWGFGAGRALNFNEH